MIDLAHRCTHCGAAMPPPAAATFACRACGTSFAANDGIPSFASGCSDDGLQAYFSRVAEQAKVGKKSYSAFAAPHLELQLAILSAGFVRSLERWVPAGSLVLDVGCGHGALLESVTQKYRMVGIDFVPAMLPMARERGYTVYHGDGSALPFEGGQFDAVLYAEVFNQVEDIRPLLAEAARVCKPEGVIVVSTLNSDSFLRAAVGAAMGVLRPHRDMPAFTGRRRPDDILNAAAGLPVDLHGIAWLLSPTLLVLYGHRPRAALSPLATNFIMCLRRLEDN